MVKYAKFNDAARGDAFPIPTQRYSPGEVDHVPSVDGGAMPPAAVMNGAVVSILLARHHIISWKIIREAWNKCIDDNLTSVSAQLAGLLTESGQSSPDANDICWARRNLIIGPVGDHRMFDPGEEIDFEGPVGMTGVRGAHVSGMVELGKLMKAYTAGTIQPEPFRGKFMKLVENCRKIDGDRVRVWVRSEWTLNRKPVAKWKLSFTGAWERDGNPIAPIWHRGSFSPASAAQFWRPGATRDEIYKETAELRRKAHKTFIGSLGNSVGTAKWNFLSA